MTLEDLLLSDDVVESIKSNINYILEIIPELKDIIGFDHKHPHHHLDVWNHTLLALSLSKKDFDVRLSLLLHDIGKPPSCIEGEVRHFYGHPEASCKISYDILERLGYSEEYIDYICYLIEFHDTPISEEQIQSDYDRCLTLFEIQRCDALAHNPEKLEKRKKYISEMEHKLLLK